MRVELRRWEVDQGPILDRLMQLYVYDLSDRFPLDLDPAGRMLDLDAARWVADPLADPWRIHLDTTLAGFALAMPTQQGWFLDDFFVAKRYRRAGVGTKAARAVFARRPGPWSLTARAENLPAVAFWTRILAGAVSSQELGDDGNLRIRFRWVEARRGR